MAERLIPGEGYVEETGAAERLIPGGGYVQETANVAGTHPVTGSLSADAASVAGTATHRGLHTSTGALPAAAASVAGALSQTGVHTSTGALSAAAASAAGSANHKGLHTSTGALSSAAASAAGTASSLNPSIRITTDVLKNDSGTTLATTTIDKLVAIKLSDLTTVTWTAQTTNSSGVLSLAHLSLVDATDYLLVTSNTAGAIRGVGKYTTTSV